MVSFKAAWAPCYTQRPLQCCRYLHQSHWTAGPAYSDSSLSETQTLGLWNPLNNCDTQQMSFQTNGPELLHLLLTLTLSISQIRAPRAWGQVWGAPTEYIEHLDRTNGYLEQKAGREIKTASAPFLPLENRRINIHDRGHILSRFLVLLKVIFFYCSLHSLWYLWFLHLYLI